MAIETECSTDRHIKEETLLLKELKERMRRNLGPDISPLHLESCIFKVPQVLRRHKPEAYEPYVVSIGPFHRCGEKFQRMETVKQWYLRKLLSRMDKSLETFLESFNKFLLDETKEKGLIAFEQRALKFYAEPLDDLKQGEFIEMMILDGCFVIELVRKSFYRGKRDADDPILNMDCMFQYICHDLLLLGNQLPWLVLRDLYDHTSKSFPDGNPQFSVVLLYAFSELKSLQQYLKPYVKYLDDHTVHEDGVLHILDLIRTSILFSLDHSETCSRNSQNDKKCLGWCSEKAENIGSDIPAATALSEAGVKFQKGRSVDNLLNIKFEHGILKIPELAIGELTEPLFRNLIAFEQCYHDLPHEITSYAIFMDKLISSDKDTKLLSEKTILTNWLNVEDGSKFFNKLYIDTTVNRFKYQDLCTKVNKYYHSGCHKNFEILRRDYCSTPWKVIAFFVGAAILVLTLLQTIFTILQ